MQSLFHFAFNVTDLDQARRFYGGVLGSKLEIKGFASLDTLYAT